MSEKNSASFLNKERVKSTRRSKKVLQKILVPSRRASNTIENAFTDWGEQEIVGNEKESSLPGEISFDNN